MNKGRGRMARHGMVAMVAALLAAGCGGAAVPKAADARVAVAIGGANYHLTSVTDFDDVRDVAASDTSVFVATDRGLLIYVKGAGQAPTRVTHSNGLPDDDVSSLALSADGSVVVATASGLTRVRGTQFEPLGTAPVGAPASVAFDGAGALWACGPGGVAKRDGDTWRLFGDRVACTSLALAKHGGLWAGTTTGLLEIEGDVIREHGADTGMPGPFVRSLAPVGSGRGVVALVDDGEGTQLAYFDGDRWYGYAPNLPGVPASVVRMAGRVILVTPGAAYAVSPSSQTGDMAVPAVSVGKAGMTRTFRGDFRVAPATPVASADDPRLRVRRGAKPFRSAAAPVPDAPTLSLQPMDIAVPAGAIFAQGQGDELYVADQNHGVVETHSRATGTTYRAGDARLFRDLGVATAANGDVFVSGRNGDVALFHDGAFRRAAIPQDVRMDAVASQGGQVYAAAITGDAAGRVSVYQWDGHAFAPLFERDLASTSGFAAVSFLAASADGNFWVGLRVRDGVTPEGKPRGVAVLRQDRPEVVLYHQTVPAVGGAASQPAPDDLSHIDLGEAGFAWFASISGAVRIGQSQVVQFGEARNVPGEIVSDVATTKTGRVWIAAAEGFGYFEASAMHFESPPEVSALKPASVAVAPNGDTWVSSVRGLARNDGRSWQVLRGIEDLAQAEIHDIATDDRGRLWIVTRDGLSVLAADAP